MLNILKRPSTEKFITCEQFWNYGFRQNTANLEIGSASSWNRPRFDYSSSF